MKLVPVTKFDKENKTIPKEFNDGIMSENCDVVFVFPIYYQSGEIQKPDFGYIVCKTYIFINSNLLSCKTENRIKKSLTNLSQYCFK